ncbi:hypothetical protein LTR28_009421 [Elasticomyces elasticus]|nr:hypothetical protein LTR28_009421 [Elasticomyces elasticus]
MSDLYRRVRAASQGSVTVIEASDSPNNDFRPHDSSKPQSKLAKVIPQHERHRGTPSSEVSFEESDSSDDYGLSVGSFDSREDEGEFDADDERDEVAEDKGAVAAAVHRPTTESLLDRSSPKQLLSKGFKEDERVLRAR